MMLVSALSMYFSSPLLSSPLLSSPLNLTYLGKSDCAKTAGNKTIHWKDAVRVFLYWIHEGCYYEDLSTQIEIPRSTLDTMLKWLIPMVKNFEIF